MFYTYYSILFIQYYLYKIESYLKNKIFPQKQEKLSNQSRTDITPPTFTHNSRGTAPPETSTVESTVF